MTPERRVCLFYMTEAPCFSHFGRNGALPCGDAGSRTRVRTDAKSGVYMRSPPTSCRCALCQGARPVPILGRLIPLRPFNRQATQPVYLKSMPQSRANRRAPQETDGLKRPSRKSNRLQLLLIPDGIYEHIEPLGTQPVPRNRPSKP